MDFLDRWTATSQQQVEARACAVYAVNRYGRDAIDHLRRDLDAAERKTARKVLRMAIRQAQHRLDRSIAVSGA